MGAQKNGAIRLRFDCHLRLEFRGAKITTDAGLLAVRELDEMMGLTEMAADLIADKRTGKNIQHQMPGLLRQSVYARLAGYEDTNDHEGLSRDPAMRAVIGKRALDRTAASPGTVSRFETEILAEDENIDALATLNSGWVSKAVSRSLAKKLSIRCPALSIYPGFPCSQIPGEAGISPMSCRLGRAPLRKPCKKQDRTPYSSSWEAA